MAQVQQPARKRALQKTMPSQRARLPPQAVIVISAGGEGAGVVAGGGTTCAGGATWRMYSAVCSRQRLR